MFFGLVVIANVKVLEKTNEHSWISLLINVLSTGSFVLAFFVESLIEDFSLYGTFERFFSTIGMWLAVLFLGLFTIVFDTAMRLANEYHTWFAKRTEGQLR